MRLFLSLALCLPFCAASVAHADTFNVSYLNAGVQASSAPNTASETFNSVTPGINSSYTTTFGNSGITGTYSGSFQFISANAYGGAGGTGSYIATGPVYQGVGNTYSLSLSQPVNFFGLWFSAMDSANDLTFYKNGVKLYDFTPTAFSNAAGTCPGSAYCGNPNNQQDSGEQFAFINFFDSNGTFDKIVFTEVPGGYNGGFESDNHTVGNLSSAPAGTPLAVTPEPSSLALLGSGVLGIIGFGRRRVFGR